LGDIKFVPDRSEEAPAVDIFHLLTLLSGARPTALKNVRVEHIDFKQRLLSIPRPKGGEEKAFDIPLSRLMVRCIIRAIRLGGSMYPEQSRTWLFPADSEAGHLVEHKEERDVLSKWGNDLRQSYRTLAQAAGVSELDIHLLMDHSLPGVNAGYITHDRLLRDHLRKQQERISAVVIEEPGFKRTLPADRWVVVVDRLLASESAWPCLRQLRPQTFTKEVAIESAQTSSLSAIAVQHDNPDSRFS
jgi:hypothetical protein